MDLGLQPLRIAEFTGMSFAACLFFLKGSMMPHIQITWIEGRTTEQKRKLVTKLTELMVREADAKPEAVTIAFVDVPAENYASNGMLVADKRHKPK